MAETSMNFKSLKTWQMVVAVIVGLFLFGGFIYGSYWLAKRGSYFLFYEDMVKQTISEMVKSEFLRQAI